MSSERLGSSRMRVLAVCLAVLFFAALPALAKKGPKISVADDPSQKNGSPELVLVELSDFQ